MLAQIAEHLFVVLGAIPLLVALLLYSLRGVSRRQLQMIIGVGAAFLLWQILLSAWLYSSPLWITWVRLVEPIFLVAFLMHTLWQDYAEGGQIPPTKLMQSWLRRLLIPLSLYLVVLVITMNMEGEGWNFVAAGIGVLFVRALDRQYMLQASQPRARYRVFLLFWLVGSLFPLPFFRLPLMLSLGWIFLRWHKDVLADQWYRMEELRREKSIISALMARLTASIRDVSDLRNSLSRYLEGLLQAIEGKAGAVYLYNAQRQSLRAESVQGYFFPLSKSVENIFTRISSLHETVLAQEINDPEHLLMQCVQKHAEIFIPYASNEPRIQQLGKSAANLQSIIAEPLVLDNELLGVLVVQNKAYERYFSASDLSVVRNFSHHATMMINSSRTLREKAERDRVQHELTLGYRIQSDLLPRSIPEVEGLQLAGSMIPAKEIGGDYYDFILVDERRLAMAIGDVSGKGVPAGMIMSICQTLLHAQYAHFSNTRDLLVSVNASLAKKIKASMFITLLLFEWDQKLRVLKYTSCGHEHILHYRRAEGRLDCLKSGGLALGMTDDIAPYIRERTLPVAPGDTVLLYTDGIIEARNPEGELFTLDRLKKFVYAHNAGSAEQIRSALVESVTQFRGNSDQVDDITTIVMRFV